jgi:hypothetical protein
MNRLNEISSVIVSKRVAENISSGRKVFKFLKFIDEMKSLTDLIRDSHCKHGILVKVLTFLARICGFFYYILDNVVWFSNMGMLRYKIAFGNIWYSKKAFNKVKWKRIKDMFTLVKNWLSVMRSFIIWY